MLRQRFPLQSQRRLQAECWQGESTRKAYERDQPQGKHVHFYCVKTETPAVTTLYRLCRCGLIRNSSWQPSQTEAEARSTRCNGSDSGDSAQAVGSWQRLIHNNLPGRGCRSRARAAPGPDPGPGLGARPGSASPAVGSGCVGGSTAEPLAQDRAAPG